jgi:hypothetical protein
MNEVMKVAREEEEEVFAVASYGDGRHVIAIQGTMQGLCKLVGMAMESQVEFKDIIKAAVLKDMLSHVLSMEVEEVPDDEGWN